MRCGRCQSLMEHTEDQSSPLSQQVWYRCPACGHERMSSYPLPLGNGAAGQEPTMISRLEIQFHSAIRSTLVPSR